MEKLEIGSKIVKNTEWTKHIETIVRETNTMWITNNETKIYKKNNEIVGQMYKKVHLATKKDLEEKEIEILKYKIKNFDLNILTLEQLKEIYFILDKKK